MRLIVTILALSLLCPASLFAAGEDGAPIRASIARAADREAARLAQGGVIGGSGGNPYLTESLVMISAGALVAILGSTMPQLRTQTDDYDLCAAAHGGPTGPSTRNPACDDYRRANKGFVWTGAAAMAAGVSLLTVGAFKTVTVRVQPGGAFVGKTTRF